MFGIGERHFDRAHRRHGKEAVGDVDPGVSRVGGLPNAAAGRAHIERDRLRWHARDRVTRPPRSGPIIRYFIPDHKAGWYRTPGAAAIDRRHQNACHRESSHFIHSVGRLAVSFPSRNRSNQ